MSPNLSDKHCKLFEFFFHLTSAPCQMQMSGWCSSKCWRNMKWPFQFQGSLPLLFTKKPSLPPLGLERGYRIYSNFQKHLELPVTHPCLIRFQSLMLLVKLNCRRNNYDPIPAQISTFDTRWFEFSCCYCDCGSWLHSNLVCDGWVACEYKWI